MPGIPDRWLNYTKTGAQIDGTQFVAFKVPLKQELTRSQTDDIQFDIAELVERLPQLGLVVDLTNTKRYYNPIEFKKYGIQYFKLATMGHEVPDRQLVKQFFRTSKLFLKDYPDKLIGVHCTHGVNRTGYFICSYMILESELSPNIAIEKFGEARGHQIERENYLTSLRLLNRLTQSKSVEKEPEAVQTPNEERSRYSWQRQDTNVQSRAMPNPYGSSVGGPRRRVAHNTAGFSQPDRRRDTYENRVEPYQPRRAQYERRPQHREEPQYNNNYDNSRRENWRSRSPQRPDKGRDSVRRPRNRNNEPTNGTYGGSSYY